MQSAPPALAQPFSVHLDLTRFLAAVMVTTFTLGALTEHRRHAFQALFTRLLALRRPMVAVEKSGA